MKFSIERNLLRGAISALLAAMLLTGLATTSLAATAESNVLPAGEAPAQSAQADSSGESEKRQAIVEEAITAIDETRQALELLKAKDGVAALEALARATGKLEIILARDPSLAFAPSDIKATTYKVVADEEDIVEVREAAKKAFKAGRLQESRRLLSDLASETVISVTSIPLATYPGAMKMAAAAIDRGELDQAKDVLESALQTLVVTDKVIPLPVTNTRAMLAEAEQLAEKEARSEEDNARLTELVNNARSELEFSVLLGYASKSEFDQLYKQLDAIEEQTADGKSGRGLFTKIKQLLNDSVESNSSDSTS
ncbi:MAG: YfdX family protein [Gammaproteobacteria bacterium]|nr:YfdX family protein [Gammaproteobacteria bacterium]